MLVRLADLLQRRRRIVLALAAAVTLAAGALGSSVADRLDPYGAEDPASESVRADERIQTATRLEPEAGLVVLVETEDGVRSPAGRERVAAVARELAASPRIGSVSGYADSRDPAFLSEDGRATYLAAQFEIVDDGERQEAAESIADRLEPQPSVTVGGADATQAAVNETVESDLRTAELLAFPLLFALSLVFFRSLVAALLPLLVGALAVVGTFLALRVASEVVSVSIFALNLTTGLGLGLAIDYSLFIVSRYREELARVGPGAEALRRTLATAGRTVLFSSLTVAAALAALLTFPQRFLYSMGLGGMLVALIAAATALVVLPAVLALLGERVNALAPRRLQRAAARDTSPAEAGAWYRLSRFVMRRPGRTAAASAALLIALGIPFLSIDFVSVDASVLPEGSPPRIVAEQLEQRFAADPTQPLRLVAQAPPGQTLSAYRARVGELPGVAAVSAPEPLGGGVSLLRAVPEGDPLGDGAQRLVEEVRSLEPPFELLVGGRSADFVDQQASLADHIPLGIAIVVGSTFVILFLMTGSVVLPIKAAVMNLLTISAAFGALVLIFQDGRFEGLLDYRSQGGLELTQPLLLFVVAFGLSTDYAVFLLSRIKEARDAGASNSEAVAVGLERTGRIVTSAALLFSVAIGAFATSQIIFIKQVGLGTALAVLIDATVVRALLVPSLMALLGSWNWWAPRQLRRLHARFGLREGAPASLGAGGTR